MTNYNTGEIFKLLTETFAFDPASLWRLCRDNKLLRPICKEVNRKASVKDMADVIIDHCGKRDGAFDELLRIIESKSERQFNRFGPYIESYDGQPLLVSGVVSSTRVDDLIQELVEWKLIHNELQELWNLLHIPLEYLTICRFRQDSDTLDQAGYKWQELCVPKLRSVPDKWNLQYAYSPALDSLREQTSRLDEITRQLMRTDVRDPEFKELYLQFEELKGILWDLLTAADKRIMALVETLQPMIEV